MSLTPDQLAARQLDELCAAGCAGSGGNGSRLAAGERHTWWWARSAHDVLDGVGEGDTGLVEQTVQTTIRCHDGVDELGSVLLRGALRCL